jgi:hypothetical protein
MDDNLDTQAKRMRELPLRLAFDWSDSAARALANTLDDMGHFNAGSKANSIADEIRVLRREVIG